MVGSAEASGESRRPGPDAPCLARSPGWGPATPANEASGWEGGRAPAGQGQQLLLLQAGPAKPGYLRGRLSRLSKWRRSGAVWGEVTAAGLVWPQRGPAGGALLTRPGTLWAGRAAGRGGLCTCRAWRQAGSVSIQVLLGRQVAKWARGRGRQTPWTRQRPPEGAQDGCDRGLRHAGPIQDRQGLEKQPSDRTTPAELQPLTGHRPSSMSAWRWPALSSSPIQQERGPGAARPPHRGLSWTLCPTAASHRANHSPRLKLALRCGKAPRRTTPHVWSRPAARPHVRTRTGPRHCTHLGSVSLPG